MSFLFSSESVSEGHPDKVCDQISDAILDEALKQDPMSRVAVETFVTTGLVVVGGEISTKADIDVQAIVRNILKEIGYTSTEYGIDGEHCAVLVTIHEQSQDIAQGVNEGEGLYKDQGAGDQGIMFGYACKQTDEMMPLAIALSHQLMHELTRMRKTSELTYIRPDSKAQVTVEYDNERQPVRVDAVVISTQHSPDIEYDDLRKDIIEKLIKKVIPAKYLDEKTKYYINPTGRFVIGGPFADTGLTGRKIIVDTYGGWGSHGGGCFSGKDSTKVDRSAAYMARYIAKNIVAAGLAQELEIQFAYAIGVKEPVSIRVNSYNSAKIEEEKILEIIKEVFNLSPGAIIKALGLRQPIFLQTAAYGHFGRTDKEFSWEKCDKVEAINNLVKAKALV